MDSPTPVNQPNPTPPRRPLPRRERRFDEPPRSMSAAPWLLLLGLVTVALLWFSFKGPGDTGTRVNYSFFRKQVDEGNVKSVKFYGEILSGKWKKIPPNPPPDVAKPR